MEDENLKQKRETDARKRQHIDFVNGWLIRLAAAVRVELTEKTQAMYLERLIQLSHSQIETACRRVIDTWDKPSLMPPIAYILRFAENRELLAEQSWEFLQTYLRKHWHPDIGPYPDAPKLDDATQYALRQVGGMVRVYNADSKAFGFIRKEFLESHQRFSAEGGEQVRLTEGQAKSTLGSLKRAELPEGWRVVE